MVPNSYKITIIKNKKLEMPAQRVSSKIPPYIKESWKTPQKVLLKKELFLVPREAIPQL